MPKEEKKIQFRTESKKRAERKKNQTKQNSDKPHKKKKFNSTHPVSPVPNGTDRVLFFWAVGAEDRVLRLVKENIAHARQQLPSMDVYLAHYDSRQDIWEEKDPSWYRKNVDFSSDSSGYKFQMMQRILAGGGSHKLDLSRYAWVW